MARLYDAFGREITPDRKPDGRTLAVTGVRDRWSTYPSKGLTPEKLGAIFREADAGDLYRQMELFEEMEEKDTHLFSQMQARKLAVTGLDFEVRPFSEDKRDRDIADFVSDILLNLPDFEDNLLDILDAIGKGYSALELRWDLRDGKNILSHMEWVHPKRFTWYGLTAPRLLTEEEPSKGMELPPFKFLFHTHKMKSGHPTRQGVLRVCAWMYLFKNYDLKDWVTFAEVYGMPLRLGKYDPSATKEDKDALIQAVRSLGTDAAGIISKSTEIEFVEAVKNSGQAVYEVLAAFCNAEMSKAILGHSASGDSTPGKLGNETQSVEVRGDLKKADCEMVSKSIRRDAIRPLVGFNFGWDVPLPWFKLHYEEQEDLDAEATRYKTFIESGMEIGEDHMYEKFGVPKPGKGEKVVRPMSTPTAPFQMKARHACPVCLVNKDGNPAGEFPDQQALDRHIDSLSPDEMQRQMEGVLKPVLEMIKDGRDYNHILENLAEAYPNLDDRALEEMLARAIFVAETWGRLNADR